jgi:hypothetical protein
MNLLIYYELGDYMVKRLGKEDQIKDLETFKLFFGWFLYQNLKIK